MTARLLAISKPQNHYNKNLIKISQPIKLRPTISKFDAANALHGPDNSFKKIATQNFTRNLIVTDLKYANY